MFTKTLYGNNHENPWTNDNESLSFLQWLWQVYKWIRQDPEKKLSEACFHEIKNACPVVYCQLQVNMSNTLKLWEHCLCGDFNTVKQLKESEGKQLLLGTFSMAKEGLDIKSLNCLILASPKSDIIQSVGRILRQKHENIKLKIIDIVDNFSIFKNQAIKRFKLYKKRNYNIKDIKIDIDEQKIIDIKEYNFVEEKKSRKRMKQVKNMKGVYLFSS